MSERGHPVLTPEQINFYKENEYLILENVVPEQLLDGVQTAIERWVDHKINEWVQEGKLERDFSEYPFNTRLMHAWNAAGKPIYNPNPTVEIVGREIFDVLTYPPFIEIAKDVFNSGSVIASGGFHCRPNLPEQSFTDTPWHQDSQCIPSVINTNFVIMWMPLMDVDENSACLQASIGKQHKGKPYRKFKHPDGYYVCMNPQDVESLQNIRTLKMKRGDLLFFTELLPHRAIPNHSEAIRWSLDIRYESGTKAIADPNRSFICAHEDPALIETSYEHWLECMHRPLVFPTE